MDGREEREGGKFNWTSFSKWGNIAVGAASFVAGIFAFIWQFLDFGAEFTPLTFLVYIYISAFGAFLVMAELNRPRCFMVACDFVRGRVFRGIFVGILATLTLTAGFTGNLSSASNIILLVVGFTTLAFSFTTCIMGTYIAYDDEPAILPTRGSSRAQKQSSTAGVEAMDGGAARTAPSQNFVSQI